MFPGTLTISPGVDASVPKKNVHTKEDADHSLPYLIAVALLDGDVQTAQLEASRSAKSDVQDLLQRVTVRPNDGFTARYPAELPSRVAVRLTSGESFTHEISDYTGDPIRPFSWKEIDAKFDKLARLGKDSCRIGPLAASKDLERETPVVP
jgi:2-methylcitrate dehydratase